MSGPLRTELKRGVGLWASVPLVVAGVAVVLAHPRDWAGDWYGWAFYLRTMLIVFGPLVVAVAAWQGGRERRRGLNELLESTSRAPLHRMSASLASPAAWSLVAFAVVATAMGALTFSYATYGNPPFLLALSAAAAVLMFAALGFVIGQLVPWRVTAPLLAIATYVGLAAVSYSPDKATYLSPGVQLFSTDLPAAWWGPATLVVFLAVGLAALLVLGPRSRWLSPVALAVAVVAATPVVQTGRDAFTADLAAEQLTCADGAPQVCLTQRHAGQLPQVAEAVQQVLRGLDAPARVAEQQFGDGLGSSTGTLNTLYVGPDLFGDSELRVLRQDAAQLAVGWRCGAEPFPPSDDLAIATFDIVDWVRDRPDPPFTGVLQGRSEAQALALVNALAPLAARCDTAAIRALLAAPP